MPRWDNWTERPRCRNCGHRCIFHRHTSAGARLAVVTSDVPCSAYVSDDFDRCGCLHYEPSPWEIR